MSVLRAVAIAVLLLAGCTSPAPVPGGRTTPSATPSATPTGVTHEQIVATIQRDLDRSPNAATDQPRLTCSDTGVARRGDVFACAIGSKQVDWGNAMVAVLDDAGTAAWDTGMPLPGSTADLLAQYRATPTGLLCRDLLARAEPPFGGRGSAPADAFFGSLVYWFLDGQPARMDEDGNGIPCETLYDADVVASVMDGGPVGG